MHRFLVGEDYYYSTTTVPCFQEKNVKKGKKMLLLEIRYPCVVRSPDLDRGRYAAPRPTFAAPALEYGGFAYILGAKNAKGVPQERRFSAGNRDLRCGGGPGILVPGHAEKMGNVVSMGGEHVP